MAFDYFYADILGHLTSDPKEGVTKNNKEIIKFSVAVNLSKELTNFIDVTLFKSNALSEKALLLKKGSLVLVKGRLSQNVVNQKPFLNLICQDLRCLDSKDKEEKTTTEQKNEEDYEYNL